MIYTDGQLNKPYYEIIQPLMTLLHDRLIEDVEQHRYTSPVYRHYLNDRIQGNLYRAPELRFITAAPDEIVTDFIASMTDDYFIDVCRALHLNDALLEKLQYYKYFE